MRQLLDQTKLIIFPLIIKRLTDEEIRRSISFFERFGNVFAEFCHSIVFCNLFWRIMKIFYKS